MTAASATASPGDGRLLAELVAERRLDRLLCRDLNRERVQK